MSWPENETDLAAPIGPWLQSRGSQPFPEVEFAKGEPIADWVAVKRGKASVFEVKKSLSFRVVRQAVWWRQHADAVSIVLPAPKTKANIEERHKSHETLQALGLGLIEVSPPEGDGEPSVNLVLHPATQPEGRSQRLLDLLKSRSKGEQIGQAGSKGGERFSAYAVTVRRLREYVKTDQGCQLKEALRNIEHHYPTLQKAVTSISKYAMQESGLRGLVAKREAGVIRLYTDDYRESEAA